MPKPAQPISEVLPPFIFGTATFNYQYNTEPHNLEAAVLVNHAIKNGITAFDTSPYYGPSEEILGKALQTARKETGEAWPRDAFTLITKVGRISSDTFDYSPQWIRKSMKRSLQRLGTDHLDLVYCHDIEFVTPAETLEAIKELRRIRDEEGSIKYIGICGYPVTYLCEIAEIILKETGEPVDAVQSYANYTLQSTLLATKAVERLMKAGVSVVPNASILGMGLLRSDGLPVGGMGDWHPAPRGLREACKKTADILASRGENSERLEVVAMRWAMESWLDAGASVGTKVNMGMAKQGDKVGITVIGVSSLRELEDAVQVWRNIEARRRQGGGLVGDEKILLNKDFREIREVMGEWADFEWESPGKDFVRKEHVEEM